MSYSVEVRLVMKPWKLVTVCSFPYAFHTTFHVWVVGLNLGWILTGELHGNLLWTCAGLTEPQKQREPACSRTSSDGTLCRGPIQASCHLLQWHPGPDGLWQQGQVMQTFFTLLSEYTSRIRKLDWSDGNVSTVCAGLWLPPTWMRRAAAHMLCSTSSSLRNATMLTLTTPLRRYSSDTCNTNCSLRLFMSGLMTDEIMMDERYLSLLQWSSPPVLYLFNGCSAAGQ